jgi:hypothetical protein
MSDIAKGDKGYMIGFSPDNSLNSTKYPIFDENPGW